MKKRICAIKQSNDGLFRNRLIVPNFDGKIELPINELVGSFFMDVAMKLKMRR